MEELTLTTPGMWGGTGVCLAIAMAHLIRDTRGYMVCLCECGWLTWFVWCCIAVTYCTCSGFGMQQGLCAVATERVATATATASTRVERKEAMLTLCVYVNGGLSDFRGCVCVANCVASRQQDFLSHIPNTTTTTQTHTSYTMALSTSSLLLAVVVALAVAAPLCVTAAGVPCCGPPTAGVQ